MQGTLEWAKAVLELDFDTVIPSHVAAPIRNGKAAFAACFPQLADQQQEEQQQEKQQQQPPEQPAAAEAQH